MPSPRVVTVTAHPEQEYAMRSRRVSSVEDARKVIGDLYGFAPEWTGFVLDQLGAAALTDEAVILIAQAQLDAEFADADTRLPTSDAATILRRRYVGEDPEREASIAREKRALEREVGGE